MHTPVLIKVKYTPSRDPGLYQRKKIKNSSVFYQRKKDDQKEILNNQYSSSSFSQFTICVSFPNSYSTERATYIDGDSDRIGICVSRDRYVGLLETAIKLATLFTSFFITLVHQYII